MGWCYTVRGVWSGRVAIASVFMSLYISIIPTIFGKLKRIKGRMALAYIANGYPVSSCLDSPAIFWPDMIKKKDI